MNGVEEASQLFEACDGLREIYFLKGNTLL